MITRGLKPPLYGATDFGNDAGQRDYVARRL